MRAKSRPKIAAIFIIFSFLSSQFPVSAETTINSIPSLPCQTINGNSNSSAPSASDTSPPPRESTLCSARLSAALRSTTSSSITPSNSAALLIAQASTGAEVADIAAVDSVVVKKQKGELLITDSLWGNLILDMAYQRDPQIRKIYKRFGLVNMGTMAAVAGIAGGTLAQGVIALATLNPQQGNDTYLPGALGIGMSGLTICTFAGRAAINHHLAKCLRKRQLEIKHEVEGVLAQIEKDNGYNHDSKEHLVALIGDRATNEWLQLWTASNAVASLKQFPSISSTRPSDLIADHNQQLPFNIH